MTKKSKEQKALEKLIEANPTMVMDTLLASSFWPPTLSTKEVYTRQSDDTDGEDQGITVAFSLDADGWIEVSSHKTRRVEEDEPPRPPITHRFRTGFGGGRSPRVRAALLVLARAIQLDQNDRPDRVREPQ